ncbi:serine/threonine-protein kinase [Propionibacteriaceae bacterium Y1700]|uniref:serine/threonine-protein kinase n=1 Tax=Microlunatus sp. Y1700 TaxID=3418487 RepID=UPI003DA72288
MKRTPTSPPVLPGYTPVSHIGSGGFADVFLYDQELPRRQVAVKVLVDSVVDQAARQRFIGEANAMARLSAHPSIVTIYFAGIAPDGRPCLVMEYCPRPNLSARSRRENIPVSEALRIGIRLSSAVETAHRAGILHRDIKPANVLVTEYGWPALTDFGIAGQVDAGAQAEGMSVPWSAPELFGDHPHTNVRSDVYALGATVYALLAGRSPFEVRGGNNSAAHLIARIERDAVPSTGRPDTGPLLEQTLARAMHKRPEARFRSAYDFARALQSVEYDLGLGQTQIDVMEGVTGEGGGDDDQATNLRGVVTIADEPGTEHVAEHTTGGSGRAAGEHQLALGPLPDTQDPAEERSGPPWVAILGIATVVVLVAVVVSVLMTGRVGAPTTEETASSSQPPLVTRQPLAKVENLSCTRTGETVACTWTQPSAAEEDDLRWQWWPTEAPEDRHIVDEPKLSAQVQGSGCVTVHAVAPDGRVGGDVTACPKG